MALEKERLAYAISMVAMSFILLIIVWYDAVPKKLTFADITFNSVQDLFVSLLLITTFKERAQQVYVIAWRAAGRAKRESAIDVAKTDEEKVTAKQELASYRAQTGRYVAVVSLVSGFFISLAGIRVLAPLISVDGLSDPQRRLLFVVDVLLTTGMLAGGSKLVHEIISSTGKLFTRGGNHG